MKAASATAARMAEAFQRNKIHPFPEMTAGTYTSSVSESARSSASPLLGTSAIDQKDNSAGRIERPRGMASPVRVMCGCDGSSMV
jgi:hypothetical protein